MTVRTLNGSAVDPHQFDVMKESSNEGRRREFHVSRKDALRNHNGALPITTSQSSQAINSHLLFFAMPSPLFRRFSSKSSREGESSRSLLRESNSVSPEESKC